MAKLAKTVRNGGWAELSAYVGGGVKRRLCMAFMAAVAVMASPLFPLILWATADMRGYAGCHLRRE